MINTRKNTDFAATNQMVAGVYPGDNNIEFVGIPETKGVIWLRNGNSHYFRDLDPEIYQLLEKKYLADTSAVQILSKRAIRLYDQVELYTYYMYGELDTTPDYANGQLAPSENWRHSETCISLLFDSKHITIGDVELSWRDIRIIDMIKKEYANKLIAHKLDISLSTLDFHLRNLYKKAGVTTKLGLINKVNQEKI